MKRLIILLILFIESTIIYGNLIVNNVDLNCDCYVENLKQAPNSIYFLSSEIKNGNNKIISRIDIKENSTVDTLFSFVDKSDTLKLSILVNNQTIIMNDIKNNKEEYLAISKNNLITRDLNDTFKIGMNACVNQNYVKERLEQLYNFQYGNGQQIFYDRLSMDYYILKINSDSVLEVIYTSYLGNSTDKYLFKQFPEYLKKSNGTINFLTFIEKVVYFGYQENELKYSIYKCLDVQGIIPVVTIYYTISNIIQSQNIDYILLYSSNSQKLIIFNALNNTIGKEISGFNLFNKDYKIDSLIAKGGLNQIDKSIYTTSKPSTLREEEKKVFPIVLPIVGVVLILTIAMVIKVVLKKKREKNVGFIDLKEEKTKLQNDYYGDNELNQI